MGEQEINMEQEAINVTQGGGAVNSVNGKTGDVVLTTSDLENTSDYQTGSEVDNAISTAIGALPTVNDATLTIQKNGVSVGTFTANDADNTTINITVPTTAADVSALPASTKYGASISVSINSSTYVMTTQLKDQDGNNLGSAQTVDLPLESVVVNGSYDSVNKKIVLTLQNGNTIDIPVADLVSGLQTEITATNKLSADLVDDTSTTNKFVTASEKSTWSGKQDALTAGANIQISASNEISATDTTYSDFTGTDGSLAGAAGLVPAPATTDAGKFLKADGTWATVSGGSGEGFNLLTEEDLNWHDQKTGDEYVALWLLPTGHYTTDENSPNVVASSYEDIDGDYVAGDPVAVDMSPLILINNNDPGNTYPDIMVIFPDSMINYIIDGSTGVVDATLEYGVPFMGTDGNADGTMGLVPAPTSADAGKFLSSDGTWDTAGGGGITELTTADYNWPVNNPVGVALWLLDNGTYYVADSSVGVYITNAKAASQGIYVVADYGTTSKQVIVNGLADEIYGVYRMNKTTGAQGAYHPYAPTVVQTTGTSTTDVMSQNATTSMIFADPSTSKKVRIGNTVSMATATDSVAIGTGVSAIGAYATAIGAYCQASGTNSVAIGQGASASQVGSVAIGDNARSSHVGEVAIGTAYTGTGYNNTNYRLLTGLYDPQSAHDAVNKEYVDPTTDSSAPTAATVGRLGQIFIDTTNADAYMCVDATNPYVWKKLTP